MSNIASSLLPLPPPQANMPNLITLLKGIPAYQVKDMQSRIARVWHRCGV